MDGDAIERDAPIYDCPIPVRVACGPSTRVVQATVRLLPGCKASAARQKLIYLEVSDETDPYFHHSLSLTEGEFQELRSEQSILVDFAAFPAKVVELLEKCAAAGLEDNPPFMATLTLRDAAPGAPSVFCLVETNNFKQITHLFFATRAGTDASIKRYLAGRLGQVRAALQTTQDALSASRHSEAQLRGDAAREQAAARQARTSLEAQVASLSHSAAIELGAAKDLAAATTHELRAQLEGLRADREALLSSLQEARTTATAALTEASSLRADNERLQAATSSAAAARETALRDAAASSLRLAVVEQQVHEKEALVTSSAAALAGARASNSALEESLALYKASVGKLTEKLESAVGEIHKGNGIIGRLQEEVRVARTKAKARGEALRVAQERVHDTDRELEAGSRASGALRGDLDRERAAKAASETALEALRAQLAEARDALNNNQTVIAWLNRELSSVQQGGAAARRGAAGAAGPVLFASPIAGSAPGPATAAALAALRSTAPYTAGLLLAASTAAAAGKQPSAPGGTVQPNSPRGLGGAPRSLNITGAPDTPSASAPEEHRDRPAMETTLGSGTASRGVPGLDASLQSLRSTAAPSGGPAAASSASAVAAALAAAAGGSDSDDSGATSFSGGGIARQRPSGGALSESSSITGSITAMNISVRGASALPPPLTSSGGPGWRAPLLPQRSAPVAVSTYFEE